jgi:hypothetical protein
LYSNATHYTVVRCTEFLFTTARDAATYHIASGYAATLYTSQILLEDDRANYDDHRG